MAARKGPDSISRVREHFDVATALKKETDEIENILRQRSDISGTVRQKVHDVLILSRNLNSDTDPDIPLILRAIYQLRGIFNPNYGGTMRVAGHLTVAERNAERARLLQRLDAGDVSKEEMGRILRRADELNAMK